MTGTVSFMSAASAFTQEFKVADYVSPESFVTVVKQHAEDRGIRVAERVFSDESGDMCMIAPGENGGSYEFTVSPQA